MKKTLLILAFVLMLSPYRAFAVIGEIYEYGYSWDWSQLNFVYWSYRYTPLDNGHGLELSCYNHECIANGW
jgi:hypothetical protein